MSYRMKGMGDVDLAPQVDAMVSAGVDPDTAYQLAVSSLGTAESASTPAAGSETAPLQSTSTLYLGGVSTTTWLIGGVALLGGLIFLSAKGRR